jgi:hypothetical protein
MDTKLRRDPSRVYSGVYLTYEGGAVYRHEEATATAFAHRDFVAPSENVKSASKATTRAIRYLGDLDEQDETITTSVELPAAKATQLRAGMRVPFKATHLPGYETDSAWCRVLSVSITPVAAGERYRLTLELAPTGDVVLHIPTVKWLWYSEDGHTFSTTIDASDNGTDWTTVATAADLTTGATDPPDVSAGTYPGLLRVDPADWSHRYWRITYQHHHPGGYWGGIRIVSFRLLTDGGFSSVCRLRTPWLAGMPNWWAMGFRPFSGDIPWTGYSNVAENDPTGRQGAIPMVLTANVFGETDFYATWTFDLLEGA